MVSLSERSYIIDGITQDIRTDGRTRLDYRYITYNHNVLPHTQSSIRIRVGATDVLAVCSFELVSPDTVHSNHGIIEFNVQSTQSSYPLTLHQQHYTQSQIHDINARLSAQLQQLYCYSNEIIDLTQLCVINNQTVWCLYIDCTIVCADGSLIDSLSIATNLVLKHLLLPKVNVTQNELTHEYEIQLLPDEPGIPLQLNNIPLAITLYTFDNDYCIDCTAIESVVCSNSLILSIHSNGTIQGMISEFMNCGITIKQLKQLRLAAQVIGKQLHNTINTLINTVSQQSVNDSMHIT